MTKVSWRVWAIPMVLVGSMALGACAGGALPAGFSLPPGLEVKVEPGATAASVQFVGKVQAMAPAAWMVAGQPLAVGPQTEIKGTFAIGDLVKVQALLAADGSLTASEIAPAEASESDASGHDLEFVGLVQSIGTDLWTVDGKALAITPKTEIKGTFAVGDSVKVEASAAPDGALTALQIEAAEQAGEADKQVKDIEFQGPVEAIGPESWTVAGKVLAVNAQTEIKGTLAVGDLAKVEAVAAADGSLTAKEIQPVESDGEQNGNEVEFSGTVEAIGPTAWTIGGKLVAIGPETEIKGTFAVGDGVKVKASVASDGSLTAREIERQESGDHEGVSGSDSGQDHEGASGSGSSSGEHDD